MAANKLKSAAVSAWRDEFERAYGEGRFAQAAALYDRHATRSAPVEIVIRAARAHMHARPPRVLELLLGLRTPGDPAASVERDCLLGEALARTHDFKSADLRLGAALNAARELGDRDLVATVGYRLVRRQLHAEDPVRARESLDVARAGTGPTARLYALYAETLILPFEERIADQAQKLLEFLRLSDPGKPEFVDLRAWATHSLAGLARELYIPHALPEIERQLSGTPWPEDFAANRFQAFKALGWATALQGDYFNAFRHLKSASQVTNVSQAWHVVAACDRAYLARCFNEHRWSRVELDEAERLAVDVDWAATLGEERIGLLLLAELFATIDASRSAMYLARHRELGDIKSSLHYRHDARLDAFARYSTGIVELALGNKKSSLANLRSARKVFERFGCDFRAARCLTGEFEATRDSNLLPRIEEKLRNYRHSWLAAAFRESARRGDKALPPMRKRVFDEICQGKSTAEIAQLLGRSKFTISNHIKELFKDFGVKNRSALIAAAVRNLSPSP